MSLRRVRRGSTHRVGIKPYYVPVCLSTQSPANQVWEELGGGKRAVHPRNQMLRRLHWQSLVAPMRSLVGAEFAEIVGKVNLLDLS